MYEARCGRTAGFGGDAWEPGAEKQLGQMQEGGGTVGEQARCLNWIFIVRCKKEQAQWEGATPLDMMNHFSKDARRSKLRGRTRPSQTKAWLLDARRRKRSRRRG